MPAAGAGASGVRHGVTLLELLLALSLSVMVLMAIGMAINLHFRAFDVRRMNVEEAQVARVALKRIADDLRSIVQYTPPDLSGLETVLGNTATAGANALAGAMGGGSSMGTGGGMGGGVSGGSGASGVGSQGASSGGGQGGSSAQGTGASGPSLPGSQPGSTGRTSAGGASGAGQAGGSGAASGGQSTSSAGTGTAASGGTTEEEPVVGLFGTEIELRIDVSRLPRVDEYEGIFSTDGQFNVVDVPSDVKTVTYFILDEEASQAAKAVGGFGGTIKPSTTGYGKGLMRSEISRAVAMYAEANGQPESAYENAKMLADEVVGIRFAYYDGTDWLTEWDSTTMGGLPKAVKIELTIMPTYAMTEEALAKQTPDSPPPEQIYTLTVNLPSAPLVAASSATQATAETSAASSTGTQSASGAAQGVAP